MNKEKEKLIFPDDTPIIISNILKKYNLKESTEEFIKKYRENEPTNGEIIAEMLKNIAKRGDIKDISSQEMELILVEKLGIDPEKAKNLAQDIKTQIINLATTEIVNKNENKEKEKEEKEKKEKDNDKEVEEGKISSPKTNQTSYSKEDIYREPID